jgi:hypothetical protein
VRGGVRGFLGMLFGGDLEGGSCHVPPHTAGGGEDTGQSGNECNQEHAQVHGGRSKGCQRRGGGCRGDGRWGGKGKGGHGCGGRKAWKHCHVKRRAEQDQEAQEAMQQAILESLARGK